MTDEQLEQERQRILGEYARRKSEIDPALYAPENPAELFMRQGRARIAARELARVGCFPKAGQPCLEIGYGTLGWLGQLIAWGVGERDLHGIELDGSRAAVAHVALPAADLRVGDASSLPWSDGSFALVIASTVFSSVLDASLRQRIASEVVRVLRPGGALLWYDIAVRNPSNSNVMPFSTSEILRLFVPLTGRCVSATLAPPLTRFMAPRSVALAAVFESLPFLRTHRVAVLRKR